MNYNSSQPCQLSLVWLGGRLGLSSLQSSPALLTVFFALVFVSHVFTASTLHFTAETVLFAGVVTHGAVFSAHAYTANDLCTAFARLVACQYAFRHFLARCAAMELFFVHRGCADTFCACAVRGGCAFRQFFRFFVAHFKILARLMDEITISRSL